MTKRAALGWIFWGGMVLSYGIYHDIKAHGCALCPEAIKTEIEAAEARAAIRQYRPQGAD